MVQAITLPENKDISEVSPLHQISNLVCTDDNNRNMFVVFRSNVCLTDMLEGPVPIQRVVQKPSVANSVNNGLIEKQIAPNDEK